jgi:hypothetical protein
MLQLLFYLLTLHSQKQEDDDIEIEEAVSILQTLRELEDHIAKVCRRIVMNSTKMAFKEYTIWEAITLRGVETYQEFLLHMYVEMFSSMISNSEMISRHEQVTQFSVPY